MIEMSSWLVDECARSVHSHNRTMQFWFGWLSFKAPTYYQELMSPILHKLHRVHA